MRALTQSLVLYVYLIFGQYYHGRVLPFMFGAWLYHNFSSLSRHLSPWQVGLFNPLNSNPKGNPTKALLKTSRFYRWDFTKTLDFIEFLGCSSALCEKRFSQFSRNFPWLGLRFLIKLNTRRVIEVVITRLSWKQFGSESPRGFESLCLRQSLGALCSKAFFFWNISMLSP